MSSAAGLIESGPRFGGAPVCGECGRNAPRLPAREVPGCAHGHPDLDLDLDEVFLDAVEAVVQTALERTGDERETRFRFFRRLLAVGEEEAVRRPLS